MARHYKGREIFMEHLLAEGVTHVFGNPGTTEMPFMDSLNDHPELTYILTLQEAATVLMADFYACASGRTGVVNLHVAPGLGNALGSLYGALKGGTPLVVTAGQQHTAMRLKEPILGHDLVAMAAPLTKWAVQAESADELPLILHRAFREARKAPSGPVFVALPMNVMEQTTTQAPMAPARVFDRLPPDPAGLRAAVELLLGASRPVILAGDGVAHAGAQAELLAVAEFLGASVWSETLHKHLICPTTSPHYRDRLPGDTAAVRRFLGDPDAVLMVGGHFFETIWHEDVPPLPEECAVVQIHAAAKRLAENYPVAAALQADPKAALAALLEALRAGADADYAADAERRRAALAELKATEERRQAARVREKWGDVPASTARLMAEVRDALPPDAIVAHETVTAASDLMRTIPFERPGDLYATRGGGIGQALPGGIGVKLAHPERPVIALSGDGSALYTVQALWSAAHHKIPVVFLIVHNRTYRILKINMDRYRKEAGLGGERPYPHMDLTDPDPDFVALAAGFGVAGERVDHPDQLGPALAKAFASGRPYLLDVLVDGSL